MASLEKFLKGKYEKLICIVQRVRFQVRVDGVFNCQQILTKICLVVFCAEMLEQFSPTSKGVFLSHSETLHCENTDAQGVLITQPTKSKSLFELIKERVIVTLLIIFAVFTGIFSALLVICSQRLINLNLTFSKTRDII